MGASWFQFLEYIHRNLISLVKCIFVHIAFSFLETNLFDKVPCLETLCFFFLIIVNYVNVRFCNITA